MRLSPLASFRAAAELRRFFVWRGTTARSIITTLVMLTVADYGEAKQGIQTEKAIVRFLATSTLIRGTWGRNQDTYLAEATFPKSNQVLLIRLVDAYPNEWPPLSFEVLASRTGTALRVTRDLQCELPSSHLLLRTAPGDPLAILLERLSYRPLLPKTLEGNELLPCYRTVRR
jgi:hypothetical protein